MNKEWLLDNYYYLITNPPLRYIWVYNNVMHYTIVRIFSLRLIGSTYRVIIYIVDNIVKTT